MGLKIYSVVVRKRLDIEIHPVRKILENITSLDRLIYESSDWRDIMNCFIGVLFTSRLVASFFRFSESKAMTFCFIEKLLLIWLRRQHDCYFLFFIGSQFDNREILQVSKTAKKVYFVFQNLGLVYI